MKSITGHLLAHLKLVMVAAEVEKLQKYGEDVLHMGRVYLLAAAVHLK